MKGLPVLHLHQISEGCSIKFLPGCLYQHLLLPGPGPLLQVDMSGRAASIPQPAVRLLDGAITFAFRMHQFVGGFDTACTQALEQLTPMWKACRQQGGQQVR
jgi:hypothetical protein